LGNITVLFKTAKFDTADKMTVKNTKKKIIAAMSGGVDSSVAAAVYCRKGYEVIGVTLRLKHPDPDFSESQTCASKSDMEAVKAVCEKLGIEHRFIDAYPEFEELVLWPSWQEYCNGRTPNPCTFCNYLVKFGQLMKLADEIGAEGVITGHYAQIVNDDGTFKLKRGSDPNKDQTYFLYRLSQEQLARINFPIGDMKKTDVREMAKEFEFKNAEKKDSQDACFNFPGEAFPETLRRLFGGETRNGDFIHEGKVVGKHTGLHKYTIGQRKGLGVALGKPGYVQAIDPESGSVELTTDENGLLAETFEVHLLNWQWGREPEFPVKCDVQVRYRTSPVKGILEKIGKDSVKVTLEQPKRAITSGQAAVFYLDKYLLGGGVIG
jgi:tRNA-specific 2-thiouridylase